MKLAVIGSRGFTDYELLKQTLAGYPDVHTIISGGASGADSLAKRYANEMNLAYVEFLPDWTKYGKSAGPIRNRQIIEACDSAVCFWDGESRGTASSIRIAGELGKPIDIIRTDVSHF